MRVGLEEATVDGGVASGAEPCEPGVNEASTPAVHVEAEEEYMATGNRGAQLLESFATFCPIKSERRATRATRPRGSSGRRMTGVGGGR